MAKLTHILYAICFFPLAYQLQLILRSIYTQRSLNQYYAEKSEQLLHKYDIFLNRTYGIRPKYSTNTYIEDILSQMHKGHIEEEYPQRENATLLMLVRNEEITGALGSMRALEDRFNSHYNYDWTFLNDVPFTDEFKEATTAMASGKTQYGLIPAEDWDRPSSIDDEKFERRLEEMEADHVLYGNSKSYRNMCRFNSGYFFRQKILDDYDYYFRVEPNVDYHCDFPYDPFRIMRERKKKYGFVIAIHEFENTIPTLWETVEEYIDQDNGEDVHMKDNAYGFITDKSNVGGHTPTSESHNDYNLCHFWSNFEIADLNFFRSERYLKFFSFLDSKGGFYYERWGDAPVHTIAAALLLDREEIIHFDQIAYTHSPITTCPASRVMQLDLRCLCNANSKNTIDITPHSCLMRWWKNGSGKYFLREDNREI